MKTQDTGQFRRMNQGMRGLLYIASGLVIIAGWQLFVLTQSTPVYFAWTVKSPLTAAFLGANYWASFVVVFFSAREKLWAMGRAALPGVLLFTTLTLVATLLHLDKFHFGSAEATAQAAAWAWLIVYVAVPPVFIYLYARQLRTPGADPARVAPIEGWTRFLILLFALTMIPLGLALFIAPQYSASLWPWSLTPLTARAVGCWLVGLGAAAGNIVRENDYLRARHVSQTAVVFAILHFIGLARFGGAEIDWSGLSIYVYLFYLLGVLAVGAWGWSRARVAAPPA